MSLTAGAVLAASPAAWAVDPPLTGYSATVTTGPLSLNVAFANPTPNGTAAGDVGSFIAYADGPDADTTPEAQCTASVTGGNAGGTTCAITGLTAAAQYTVTTVARNLTNTANLPSAVAAPTTQTATPTKLVKPTSAAASASGSTGEVAVSWVAGTNTNATVSNFTATAYIGSNATDKSCTTASGTVYACTITGLTNGTPYNFKVTANGTDASAKSDTTATVGAVTPGVKPAAPTDVVASTDAAGAVTVNFTPSTTAAVTDYDITAYKEGVVETTEVDCSAGVTAPSTAVTCVGSGIVAGSQYTFAVVANTTDFTSDATTSPAILLVTAPATPGTPTAEAGDTQATLTWTAPTTGTVAKYRASVSAGGVMKSCVTSTLTCTITGLTNATAYTTMVEAINSFGTAKVSSTGTVTPHVVPKPAAPTVTTPAPADIMSTAANITWTPAAAVNGAPVVYYTVTATPHTAAAAPPADSDAASAQDDSSSSSDDAAAAVGAISCTVAAPATTCSLQGLMPGTQYDVTVKAYASATVYSTAATTTITTKSSGSAGAGSAMSGPIVANRDGMSQMFAKAWDGNLYTSVRDSSGNWGAWSSLGGLVASDPVAVSTGTGASARLIVFALGAGDHAVWYRLQDATGTGFGQWTHVDGSKWVSSFRVVKNSSGTVQVFAKGAEGNLYYSVNSASDAAAFQSWVSLGGIIASEPNVVQWDDGTLEVFAIGIGDGQVWHTKQSHAADNTSWVWWSHVSPTAAQNVSL